jgi:formylglycine-generating enzyme required for sulfatase activity
MRRLIPLLVLCATLAHAADTYVVAAGVEKYEDERISSVRFAVADAKAVAGSLRASGINPKFVTVLASDETDAGRRPTRIGLVTALENVKERAKPEDKLIFFFAGHGVQEGDQQYLLTCDTRRSLVRDTALPMSLINAALEGLQASEVLFLVDACRNEPNAGRAEADAKLSEAFARGLMPHTLHVPTGKPSVLATLLACDVGQRAWEDPASGHGVFTTFLLRGMAGTAASPDGQVRLSGLASYLEKEVSAWAERQGKAQSPRLFNPSGSDMVVTVPPPEPVVSVSFANQTLAAVMQLLAEQYNAQIVLGEGADPTARVTGTLDDQPLSRVLRILVNVAHLKVRRDGRVYIIEGAGASTAPVAPESPVAPPAASFQLPDYLRRWQSAMPTNMQFRISPKDGMPQVLIPEGSFTIGSPDGQGRDDEHPQRRVTVSAYWMDSHDVTVAQYRRFCQATGYDSHVDPPAWGWQDSHPMVNVSYDDAVAYANWAGRQLPTEAQWERAARGGLEGKTFPWGDNFDETQCAYNGQSTEPVGSHAPNGFGLFDMVGNVWQWCRDWYDPGWYTRMPDRDPENTIESHARVVRGGTWSYLYTADLLVAHRNWAGPPHEHRDVFGGFRCVQAAGAPAQSASPVAPNAAPSPAPAPSANPRSWLRVGPLGDTPKREHPDLPLSDQASAAGWVRNDDVWDDFVGDKLDLQKWNLGAHAWEGSQPVWFDPRNVVVADHTLQLMMRHDEPAAMPKDKGYHTYTSGCVTSKRNVQYGYVEFRARLMRAPIENQVSFVGWPDDEIDIGGFAPANERKLYMYLQGRMPTGDNHEKSHFGGDYLSSRDLSDDFHVYGFEWDAQRITIYLDGVPVRWVANTVWQHPLGLMIAAFVEPGWQRWPKDADLPSSFTIQYVHAWRKPAAATTAP